MYNFLVIRSKASKFYLKLLNKYETILVAHTDIHNICISKCFKSEERSQGIYKQFN